MGIMVPASLDAPFHGEMDVELVRTWLVRRPATRASFGLSRVLLPNSVKPPHSSEFISIAFADAVKRQMLSIRICSP